MSNKLLINKNNELTSKYKILENNYKSLEEELIQYKQNKKLITIDSLEKNMPSFSETSSNWLFGPIHNEHTNDLSLCNTEISLNKYKKPKNNFKLF